MPRKLRVEYPGAIYHVMNRGDRREPIFRDDADRKLFLATLDECCGKTDWRRLHPNGAPGTGVRRQTDSPPRRLTAVERSGRPVCSSHALPLKERLAAAGILSRLAK